MQIDIWSDIACPWCYVGKRRLEAALGRFEHRDDLRICWRSFELDPFAPPEHGIPQVQLLASKYGVPISQAEAMNARMAAAARDEGLELHFELVRVGNTFDAHRLTHLAAELDLQDAMKERLMRAYLTEGLAIGRHEVLELLAADVALDPSRVRAVLASNEFADAVRADEARARELGISGVPFFVLAGRYGVSGAQSSDLLLDALRQAYSETRATVQTSGKDARCDGDGCGI